MPTPPNSYSEPHRLSLLQLKIEAGLASADERRAFEQSWTFIGPTGGLAVPRPLPVDVWLERKQADSATIDARPPLGEQPTAALAPKRDHGGIFLCAPDAEPPPAGKPSYRGGRRTRRG